MLVRDTDGFSFAYLKELFLSAMIRWMKTRDEALRPRGELGWLAEDEEGGLSRVLQVAVPQGSALSGA